MGYIGVITRLLTFDPNFLGHPSNWHHWFEATRIILTSSLPYMAAEFQAKEGYHF